MSREAAREHRTAKYVNYICAWEPYSRACASVYVRSLTRYAVRYESWSRTQHRESGDRRDYHQSVFTVADKTLDHQAFVFSVAVSIETSTASMSQCIHVYGMFTSRGTSYIVLHRRSTWVCILSIPSAIGTQRNHCYARAVSYHTYTYLRSS